jgi:hypothetical protein
MTTYQFLSDDWLDAARAVKSQHEGDPVDQAGLTVNSTLTGVPFGDGTLELHSSHGPVIGWEPGHDPDAAISIRLDYEVAKDLVKDDAPNALERALGSGDIEVSGDHDAFRDWWHSRVGDERASALDAELRDLTT